MHSACFAGWEYHPDRLSGIRPERAVRLNNVAQELLIKMQPMSLLHALR